MNRLIKAKNELQKIAGTKPTNQKLMQAIETHLQELSEIIEDEKYIVRIDKRKNDGNSICESEVKKIAADICKVNVKDIEKGTRKTEVVCARWFVLMYLNKFSSHTRKQQGAIVGKDHATATYALKEVQNFSGWRKMKKIKFENTINQIHETVGINKYFE